MDRMAYTAIVRHIRKIHSNVEDCPRLRHYSGHEHGRVSSSDGEGVCKMVTDVRSAALIRLVKRGDDPSGEAAAELARRFALGDRRTLGLLTTMHRRHPTQCDLADRTLAVSDPATVTPLRRMVMALARDRAMAGDLLTKVYESLLGKLGITAEELSREANGMAREALARLHWRSDSEHSKDLAQHSITIFLSRLVLRPPLPPDWHGMLASIVYRTAKGARRKETGRARLLKQFGPEYRARVRMAEDEEAMLFIKEMVLRYDTRPRLLPALENLPTMERAIVDRRILRGETFAQIAEALGVGESTVHRRFTAATHTLWQSQSL